MIAFVLCIAILALLLWLSVCIARWFADAAAMKGHTDKKYFWICFWLGWIGYLLVVALPDRGGNDQVVTDELPDL